MAIDQRQSSYLQVWDGLEFAPTVVTSAITLVDALLSAFALIQAWLQVQLFVSPLSCVLVPFSSIRFAQHLRPALPSMPLGKNFSFFHLLGFPQNAWSLSHVRSPLQSRAGIFSRCHVHQLRLGPCVHLCSWRSPLGPDRLAFGQDCNLGGLVVPALRPHADVSFACTLDLSRSEDRSRAPLISSRLASP